MPELRATYYDGRTTRPHEVLLHVGDDGLLHVRGDGVALALRADEVRIAPRLGDTPRSLTFIGGDKCETADNDAVDALARRLRRRPGGSLVHRLESSWRAVAACLALLVVAAAVGVVWGVPLGARVVAASMPDAVAYRVGEGTLAVLDETMFDDSALSATDQERVQRAFAALSARAPSLPLTLTFRKLGVPNAFALPNGTVIMTDELVELADSDEELLAVLAHEIGHVHHRHGLRMALESSSVALLVSLYIGDATQVSTILTALPTVYAQAGYSRAHEEEADGYALALMEQSGLDPLHFATIMRKLDDVADSEVPEAVQYLSSHPPTKERVERFERRAVAATGAPLP